MQGGATCELHTTTEVFDVLFAGPLSTNLIPRSQWLSCSKLSWFIAWLLAKSPFNLNAALYALHLNSDVSMRAKVFWGLILACPLWTDLRLAALR